MNSAFSQIALLTRELEEMRKQMESQQAEIQRLVMSEKAVADANVRIAELYMELSDAQEQLVHSKEIERINRELQELNNQVVRQNKNIISSINYARRIQEAVLPTHMEISSVFNDYFIFYRPRDIVSGDFYWLKHRAVVGKDGSRRNFKVVFAGADCTGHGVPGAFMSLIGDILLQKIVIDHGITSPELILKNLHSMIRDFLKQGSSDSRDGMDIAICTYDPYEKTLEYAGAHAPLYISQNGEILEIKPSKFSVGGRFSDAEVQFEKHVFELKEKTEFYMVSDGFPDQIGGPEGRKIMKKGLKTLLDEIHDKSVLEQRNAVEDAFDSWKGSLSQVDDVLFMGFRWNP